MDAFAPLDFRTFFLWPFAYAPGRDPSLDIAACRERRDRLVEHLLDRGRFPLWPPPDGETPGEAARAVAWQERDWPAGEQEDGQEAARFDVQRYLHPHAWAVLAGGDGGGERPGGDGAGGTRDHRGLRLDLGSGGKRPRLLAPGTVRREIELCGVRLHLFDNGVGILTIETRGEGLDADTVLRFNESFRWVGRRYAGQALPGELTLDGAAAAAFDLLGEEQAAPGRVSNRLVRHLLAPLFEPGSGGGERAPQGPTPLLGTRMYVLTWVAATRVADGVWMPLLNVDAYPYAKCMNDPAFEQGWRTRHEYRRWWRDHRIGFTLHSAAFLGRLDDTFYNEHVQQHVRTVYYAIVLLVLAQRASLLVMADRSAELARRLAVGDGEESTHGEVAALREAFLLFANRMWFGEISHEEQGIEMGRLCAEALGTPPLFEELRSEIEAFEAHLTQRREQRTSAHINALGLLLAACAFFVGMLGANVPGLQHLPVFALFAVISLVLTVALVAGGYRIIRRVTRPG